MYKEKVETCGSRIATALKTRGMKQYELCKLAKVPKSSLSLYLSGAYEPKQERIYNIAKVLNVNEAWLMGYDVPMERQDNSASADSQLTPSEETLLTLFRQIPEDKQQMVLQMITVAIGGIK